MIRYTTLELSHIKLGWTNIFEFFKIMEIVQVKAFMYEVSDYRIMFFLKNRNDISQKMKF